MINQTSGQAGHRRVTGLFDSPTPGPHECPEERLFGGSCTVRCEIKQYHPE
jgi:hypothetical protein